MVSIITGFVASPLVTGSNFLQVNSAVPNVFSSPGVRPCAFTALKYAEEIDKNRKHGTSNLDSCGSKFVESHIFRNVNIRVEAPSSCSRRQVLNPIERLSCTTRRNSCIPSLHFDTKLDDAKTDIDKNAEPCLTKMIGRGGFGRVYLAVLNKHRVAVKKLHKQTKNEKAKEESFKAEMKAKSLVHPNIVRVLSTSEIDDCDKAYIVMEYVSDSNVQQILDDPKEVISAQRRLSFALDIARALDFIHENCLVHLDVKPANILVTLYDSCKLGDFGCCQVVEHGTGRVSPTQRSYLTGTFAYRAPELLRGEAPSTMADIYSFAITLWQLASRRFPYSGLDQHVVIFGVVANNLRPILLNSCKQSNSKVGGTVETIYEDIYTQCWHYQPEKRISAKALADLFASSWKETI